MPKNKVSDPITDQEIAFARLVLSGSLRDSVPQGRLKVAQDDSPG